MTSSWSVVLLLCVSLLSPSPSNAVIAPHADVSLSDQPLTSLTFGSCNKHNAPQPMWEFIRGGNGTTSAVRPLLSPPDVWVWLGDVIYGDSFIWPFAFFRYPSTMDVMKQRYDVQQSNPGYRALVESPTTHVVGVWDDHDYGLNDGDRHYVDREKTQSLFLDFLHEASDSKRRTRGGVYASYMWGPEGRRVLLILLDIRYHQDYAADDILGSEQWAWLEETLVRHDPQLIIIGGGIQFLARDRPIGEGWRSFPKSKARLFHLLHTSNMVRRIKWNEKYASTDSTVSHPYVPAGHIFLSGDVHFSELTTTSWCEVNPRTTTTTTTPSYQDGDELWIYPLLDITSSGLTHSIGHQTFGLIDYAFQLLSSHRPVWTRENFGRLDIHWDTRADSERHSVNAAFPQPPSFSSPTFVHLNVYNLTGGVSPVSGDWKLSDLQPIMKHVVKSRDVTHPTYPLEPVAHLIPHDCVMEEKLALGHIVLYSISGIKGALLGMALAFISLVIALRIGYTTCRRWFNNKRPNMSRQASMGKKKK